MGSVERSTACRPSPAFFARPHGGAVRWHDLLVIPPSVRRCERLARDVVALRRPAVIAVDGVDGSGKTTFANQLARAIDDAGRPAVVVHEDDFLAPRESRYRLGRQSPEGFFRDSYNLPALITHVLDPLRPGGDRRVRRRLFDHRTDAPVDAPVEDLPVTAVVIRVP